MAKILNLGGLAQALTNLRGSVYAAPGYTISGVNPNNWPTAGQPMRPIGPEGSRPLAFPFYYGQNLNTTPRSDAPYSAADLQTLATYPLARICIDNTMDTICQISWKVQLRQMPGESDTKVKARRDKEQKGDLNIRRLSKLLERPNRDCNWQEWMRPTLQDMLITDSANTLMLRTLRGDIGELRWTPGHVIARYIDDNGFTPEPESPAYAQLWGGLPRVQLTTRQMVYKPRNIFPRAGIESSYLFGFSPVESIADEIKVGISRLMFILAYYQEGAVGNMLHVAPPEVTADKIEEAARIVNAQLAGNFGKRRQYTILQGFQRDGKRDQLEFPKEPVLADVFDEVHIRKICFAFGTSPQRLQRMMNRASAVVSQQSSQEEGIRPYLMWAKGYVDYIIQVQMECPEYEIDFSPYFESDITKRAKVDASDVHEGIRTRNEIRVSRGEDRVDDPMADRLCVTTANGVVRLGEYIVSGKGGGDPLGNVGDSSSTKDSEEEGNPTPPAPSVTKPNGKPSGKARLIERGE